MQTNWNRLQRLTPRGSWLGLLAILVIGLFATAASASAPPLVLTQTTYLTPFASGGQAWGADGAAGASMAMNSKGVIVAGNAYENQVQLFTPSTGYAVTIAGTVSNVGAVAIDSHDYLYVGGTYGNSIIKVPMNSDGSYTISSDPFGSSFSAPTCAGDGQSPDTAGECLIAPLTVSSLSYFGVESMTVDTAGDLFVATDDQGTGYTIFECATTCLYGATPTGPVTLYAEPAAPSPNLTGQLQVGTIALDPWGNLFFTDSALSTYNTTCCGKQPGSHVSNLNEIPADTSSSTGFSTTPTLDIVTLTPGTPGAFDDQINAVAIDATGNVYFALANSGIYGLVDASGTVNTSSLYAITNVGSKLLLTDGKGNFYTDSYNNGDTLTYTQNGGSLTFPGTAAGGTGSTESVFAADSTEACGSTTFTFGSTDPEYTGVVATTPACSGSDSFTTGTTPTAIALAGSFTPVTITFAPTATGTIPSTFTVTDTASGSSGTLSLTGQGLTAQAVTMTFSPTLPAPVAPATTPAVLVGAGPWTITTTGGASGNPVVLTLDSGTTSGIATLTANTNGSYTLAVSGAGTVVVDANQAGNATYAAATPVQQSITVTSSSSPITGNPAITGDMIVNQQSWGAKIQTGGMWGSDSAGGTSGGVNSQGTVVVGDSYGGYVEEFPAGSATSATAASTELGQFSGVASTFIDSQGYLWMTGGYGYNGTGALVVKEPMQSDGTYASWSSLGEIGSLASGGSIPNCTGDGQAPDKAGLCMVNSLTAAAAIGNTQIGSMYVDGSGDLFFTTDDVNYNGQTAQPPTTFTSFAVFECSTSCLYGATPTAPVKLFQESEASYNPSATIPNYGSSYETYIGAVAVDPTGNVFFTDSQFSEVGKSTEYSLQSNLWEIPYTAGTGYATTPTQLATYTPSCGTPPCNYNNEIDSVATDTAGNVYFADQYNGIYEIANVGGVLDAGSVVALVNRGSKLMIPDGKGNFFYFAYNGNNKDSIGYVSVANGVNVTPETSPGSPVSTSNLAACTPDSNGTLAQGLGCVYVVDNAAACSASPNPTFTFADSQFTATTELMTSATPPASTCGSFAVGNASSFPAMVTFNPLDTSSGATQETGQINDPDLGGTGSIIANGLAEIAQPITGFSGITSPVVYGGGPYTLSATGGASGNPIVFAVDSGTTQVGGAAIASITGNTLTITGVGTVIIDVTQAGGTVGGTTYASGSATETITVNQAPQTIQFGTLPTTVSFGVAPITLSATDTNVSGSGSGNSITLSLDSGTTTGAATLTGNVLTITGLGTVIVDAAQAGNADYLAGSATATITVTQGTQTITFAPPATVPYGSKPVTLTATASSGLAVTLALNTSKTTSTGSSLTGNVLTIGGLGNIVIDANQAGNTNWGAATQVEVTIQVTSLGTVATPVISPASGTLYTNGTPADSITITDATSGSAIYYTTDGSNPLTSSTAVAYTAAIKLPQSTTPVTITAAATALGYLPSTSATATYTVSNLPPNFTVSVNPPSVTLKPGGSATVDITITPNASFANIPVTFACSGAPAGVSCAFSPATVTPDGVHEISTVLTITYALTSSALRHGPNPFIPGGATFALALCFFGWKRRRGLVLGLVLMAGVFGLTQLTGCGSNSGNSLTGTTTTSMTVTATGGGVTQTIPVSIQIEK